MDKGSQSTLGAFAQDFFKIEVNTIIKDGISAESVPLLPIALFEIAEGYALWLKPRLDDCLPKFPPLLIPVAGPSTFMDISVAAAALVASDFRVNEERAIAWRIQRNAIEVQSLLLRIFDPKAASARKAQVNVFKKLYTYAKNIYYKKTNDEKNTLKCDAWNKLFCSDEIEVRTFVREFQSIATEYVHILGFMPEDISFIAKVWDIGTETIVMQSVVQISGDVVTRISGDFALEPYAGLHQTHFRAVGVAVDAWSRLTELLVKVGGALIGLATKRG